MGAAYLLPKLIGLGRATELLYFGDSVDAATAERYGLVNRVVPANQLLDEAMSWAERLANGPTFALGITKELLNEELNADLHSALDTEARAQALCFQTRDFREAYDAFVNKRPARFTGG
jgi:enoyl-CoA hydratase/carnithine racemase